MIKRLSFVIVLLLQVVLIYAQTFQLGDLYYSIVQGTYGGTNEVSVHAPVSDEITEVTIPSTVQYNGVTYTVTRIKSSCFNKCLSLVDISIPSSVYMVGDFCFTKTAFFGDEKNWKDGMLIIDNILIFCKNTNSSALSIPDGIRVIADGALANREELTSITIPSSVTSIGNDAFQNVWRLSEVRLPENLEFLGARAFQHSRMSSLSLPSTLKYIGIISFPWSLVETYKFDLYCPAAAPPLWTVTSSSQAELGTSSYSSFDYKTITAHVPASAMDSYNDTNTLWSFFTLVGDITPVEDVKSVSEAGCRKVMENGIIYILRDGRRYNLLGTEVR